MVTKVDRGAESKLLEENTGPKIMDKFKLWWFLSKLQKYGYFPVNSGHIFVVNREIFRDEILPLFMD